MNGLLHPEDMLRADEPRYRSRGEVQIGRLLERAGIPFLYEHPTALYDRGRWRTWHPDFVLPTYGMLIVEYAGMPEVPAYRQGMEYKQRAYARNELPALFVMPDDLRGCRWPQRLLERIETRHPRLFRRNAAGTYR